MESARATETSTPGLVLVDKADYDANRVQYNQLRNSFPRGWEYYITFNRGMGDKVREVWKDVQDREWLSILNDDHFMITPHWDTKLIAQINGKNIVSCADGLNCPPRMGGCTLWSLPLLKAVGWPIFPPMINHLGIDDVWEQLGRATGCWIIDSTVLIEHRHEFLKPVKDETHRLTYGDGPWDGSKAHLEVCARMQIFKEDELPGAIERIMALKGAGAEYLAAP